MKGRLGAVAAMGARRKTGALLRLGCRIFPRSTPREVSNRAHHRASKRSVRLKSANRREIDLVRVVIVANASTIVCSVEVDPAFLELTLDRHRPVRQRQRAAQPRSVDLQSKRHHVAFGLKSPDAGHTPIWAGAWRLGGYVTKDYGNHRHDENLDRSLSHGNLRER
jgi:hypothetical protein